MKRLITFIIYFLLFSELKKSFCSSQTIFYNKKIEHSSLKQNHIIFAWDLNDVIFYVNYTYIVKHPVMALKLGKIHKKQKKQKISSAGCHLFEAAIKEVKPKKFQKYIDATARITQPDQGMIDLMQRLKDKGCQHTILSNIGKDVWISKQNILDDHVRSLFESYERHMLAQQKDDCSWICKPNANMYQEYLKKQPKDAIIIFIDDKLENIHAALENGITIGILFQSKEQLEKDLALLGL